MNNSKPWYLSKTIWASLVAVAASLGSILGIDIDEAQRLEITDLLMQTIMVGASLLAVLGRLAAKSQID